MNFFCIIGVCGKIPQITRGELITTHIFFDKKVFCWENINYGTLARLVLTQD